MSRTPVILDCDPGHDDVFAIWLAAAHPAIELLAVTTVAGNSSVVNTGRNARIAVQVAGRADIPVAAGAAAPLVRALSTAEWMHGESGLAGPLLPEPVRPLDPRHAVDLLADTLSTAVDPVTIVATGPLTNVAMLLAARPDLAGRIREVSWMGGSTGRGNVTPYAEFNSWVDPDALAVVLASGVPFTMVGLNVTHSALVTGEVRSRIAAAGTRTAAFGTELLDHFCRANDEIFGMPDGPLHDPVAAAVIADPGCVRTVRTRVDVELAGAETLGATSVDLDGILARPANARVAVGLEVERFWDLIADAVTALD